MATIDGHAEVEGAPDELLLDDRHLLERQLHAEIAAGDHHGIGGAARRRRSRRRRPGSRSSRRSASAAEPSQRAQLADVVGPPDEGLCQVVGAERRDARGARRSSSVSVGRERRSDGTLTPACGRIGPPRTTSVCTSAPIDDDAQLGGSVREQDSVAGPQVLAEGRIPDVRAGGVARSLDRPGAGRSRRRWSARRTGSTRSPRRIFGPGRSTSTATVGSASRTRPIATAWSLIGPVGEVDARDVHAGRQRARECGRPMRGRWWPPASSGPPPRSRMRASWQSATNDVGAGRDARPTSR